MLATRQIPVVTDYGLPSSAYANKRALIRVAANIARRAYGSIQRRAPTPAQAAAAAVGVGAARSAFRGARSFTAERNLPIVSAQNDVSVRTRRKRTRGQKIASRNRRKRVKRFRRKIRRAIPMPKFKFTFTFNAGRSFKSATNSQSWFFIPMCGYRGVNIVSPSVASAGAALPSYSFRSDQAQTIVDLFRNSILYPSGAAANSGITQWWVRIKRATLDISVTNNGTVADGTELPVEWDMYHVWSKNDYSKEYFMNDMEQIDARVALQEQAFGNVAPVGGAINIADCSYEPWCRPHMKKFFKWTKLATGYLKNGETMRVKKTAKIKKLLFKKQWEEEDSDATTRRNGIMPGFGGAVVFCWRGVPTINGSTGGYRAARLAFNINQNIYVSLPGQNTWGASSGRLYADTYA